MTKAGSVAIMLVLAISSTGEASDCKKFQTFQSPILIGGGNGGGGYVFTMDTEMYSMPLAPGISDMVTDSYSLNVTKLEAVIAGPPFLIWKATFQVNPIYNIKQTNTITLESPSKDVSGPLTWTVQKGTGSANKITSYCSVRANGGNPPCMGFGIPVDAVGRLVPSSLKVYKLNDPNPTDAVSLEISH